jgi:hypothetical protein
MNNIRRVILGRSRSLPFLVWLVTAAPSIATAGAPAGAAAQFGRAVEVPRRVGNQASYGICSVAAGEAVEHGLGSRRRELEHRAATAGANVGAARKGRAVEIARRGDRGEGICSVGEAGERVERGQRLRRGSA